MDGFWTLLWWQFSFLPPLGLCWGNSKRGSSAGALNLCTDQFRKEERLWTCNFCYNSQLPHHGRGLLVGAAAGAISAKFAPIWVSEEVEEVTTCITTILPFLNCISCKKQPSCWVWVCLTLRSVRSLNWYSLKCWKKLCTCCFCWEVTALFLASVFPQQHCSEQHGSVRKPWI